MTIPGWVCGSTGAVGESARVVPSDGLLGLGRRGGHCSTWRIETAPTHQMGVSVLHQGALVHLLTRGG